MHKHRTFLRYLGFNPTRNQSEFGAPMFSTTGRILKASGGALLGKPTLLPGPFHFMDQVGRVDAPTYATVPVVWPRNNFNGEVPLSEHPIYERGAPWTRGA